MRSGRYKALVDGVVGAQVVVTPAIGSMRMRQNGEPWESVTEEKVTQTVKSLLEPLNPNERHEVVRDIELQFKLRDNGSFRAFCEAIRGHHLTIEPGAHLMALGRLFPGDDHALATSLSELTASVEALASARSGSDLLDEVIPNWKAGLAYLQAVLETEGAQWTGGGGIVGVFHFYFARRWARSGYPTIEMGHKVAASLMFTHGDGDVPAPWRAFNVKIPDGLVTLRLDDTEASATRVLCMAPDESIPQWVLVVFFRKTTGPDVGSEAGFRFVTTSLDETIHVETDDGKGWPELDRAGDMICRLVAGACMLASAKQDVAERRWRPKSPPGHRRRPGVEPPEGTRFIVTKNVTLDLREQVSEYIAGTVKPGRKLTCQFVVRGHRRHQAHGPHHSLRKLVWIEPFWKGPEEGRALMRGYELGIKAEREEPKG